MINRDELENELEVRRAFMRVFLSADGREVLTIMRNRLGAFSGDPAEIKPDLIAFDVWLLNKLGIIHGGNLFAVQDALADVANEKDLQGMIDALQNEE